MEFFISVGMGLFSHIPAPQSTDFTIVVSGEVCTPCKALMPLVDPVTDLAAQPQLSAAWSGQARCRRGIQSLHVAAVPGVGTTTEHRVTKSRSYHRSTPIAGAEVVFMDMPHVATTAKRSFLS